MCVCGHWSLREGRFILAELKCLCSLSRSYIHNLPLRGANTRMHIQAQSVSLTDTCKHAHTPARTHARTHRDSVWVLAVGKAECFCVSGQWEMRSFSLPSKEIQSGCYGSHRLNKSTIAKTLQIITTHVINNRCSKSWHSASLNLPECPNLFSPATTFCPVTVRIDIYTWSIGRRAL